MIQAAACSFVQFLTLPSQAEAPIRAYLILEMIRWDHSTGCRQPGVTAAPHRGHTILSPLGGHGSPVCRACKLARLYILTPAGKPQFSLPWGVHLHFTKEKAGIRSGLPKSRAVRKPFRQMMKNTKRGC